MMKSVIAVVAAGALTVISASASSAGPISGAAIADLSHAAAPIEKTRLFCYNKYTGRFLHWGSCGGGYGGGYNRPRVYCRNRYTGRFIHWGAC